MGAFFVASKPDRARAAEPSWPLPSVGAGFLVHCEAHKMDLRPTTKVET
jgi:hypothetical protein